MKTYFINLYEAFKDLRRTSLTLVGTNQEKLDQVEAALGVKIISINQVSGDWVVVAKRKDKSKVMVKNPTKMGALRDLATILDYKLL